MNPCYERARQGEPSATRAVVEALRPRISKMAAHYARCTGEDPDDLLQEAWVGLLEALPELDVHIGSPEQYLIQRARWSLLDAVRRARVRRCPSLEESGSDLVPAPETHSAFATACVAEFLRGLKPVQRAIVRHLLAGRTWREVGSAMGCTSANIAYHMRQIRREYEAWARAPESAARKRGASRTEESGEARPPQPFLGFRADGFPARVV